MHRRSLIAAAIAAPLATPALLRAQESFPTRPLRMLVP